MKRSLIYTLVLAALSGPAALVATSAHAEDSPHTFTGNAAVVSDYRFRGISQTYKEPALQGGLDYSHSSGLYLGTWASTLSRLSFPKGNGIELDLYGGYKWEVAKDTMLDVGVLHYYYSGASWSYIAMNGGANQKFNNTELYFAANYKWLSGKVSYAVSDYFGTNASTVGNLCETSGIGDINHCIPTTRGGSKGTTYTELNAAYPLSDNLTLNAHVGYLRVNHYSELNYTDWKLGVNYNLNGWSIGANYVDTNANKGFYNIGKNGNLTDFKKLGTSTVVLSVGTTF